MKSGAESNEIAPTPPTGVLLSQAVGRSTVHETIYEDRLEWLSDLRRMGAQARIIDAHRAVITGPTPLQGAEVEVGDLRAGARHSWDAHVGQQ